MARKGKNETSVTFTAHNEEFNKAIKEMNAESKTLRKEFKLTEAQLQQTGTETEKMAASLNYLETAQQQAADKVALTKRQLESIKQTFGENSIEAKKMADRLLDAETAHQKLSNQVTTTKQSLENLQQSTSDTSRNMKQLADEEIKLGDQTTRLNAQFDLQKSKLGENATETDKLELKYRQLMQQQQNTAEQTANMEQQLQMAKQTFGANSTEVMQLETKLTQLHTAENKLATEINNTKGAMDRQENNLRDLQTLFQATGTDITKFNNILGSDLVTAINKGTANSKQLERAIDLIGQEALGTDADLDRMKASLRQIDSGGSLKGVKKDLNSIASEAKLATREAGRLKDAISNIGSGAAAGGAAGAAGAFGLVQGMQDLNTDMAKLRTNAVLAGADLGIVEEAFMQLTTVTGETDSAVETVSNLLASGFEDQQLAAVIDQVNGAAIKFSDTLKTEGIADGIQETFATGEAIGSFAELLERSGVDLETFNEGLAKAQEKGEGTNYILQTMADLGFGGVLQKYKELNPEVEKNATANANLQQAMADLGIALTPIIVQVTDLVTKFSEWAAKNPELAQGFTILAGLMGIIGGAVMALMPVFLAISNAIGFLVTKISAAGGAMAVLRTAFTFLTGPVGIAIAAITAVIAIGVLLYKNWDEISAKAIEIWGRIKEYFSVLFAALKVVFTSTWDSIKSYLSVLWSAIKTIASTVWDGIKTYFTTVLNGYKTLFTTVWNAIKTVITTVWNGIKTTATTIFNGIKSFFTTVLNGMKTTFTTVWNAIKSVTTSVFNSVKSFLQTVWNGIKSTVTSVVNGIKTVITTVWNGIKTTVTTVMNAIKTVITNAWNGAKLIVTTVVNGIKTVVSTVFNGLKTVVSTAMTNVKSAIVNGWNSAKSFLQNINLKSIGKDIISGLVNGIGSMAGSIKKKVKELAALIPKGVKDFLDVRSPSRVLMELGEFSGEGLAVGIENMKRTVASAAEMLATAAVPDVNVGNLTGGFNAKDLGETINMTVANQQPIIVESVTYLDGEEIARNQEPYLDTRFGNATRSKLFVNGRRG